MDRYLVVALGSAVGGMARFWLTQMGAIWWGAGFPWGTLLINLVGSLVIGLVAGLGDGVPSSLRLLLMTGVCGGFTTFSAFSLQSVDLIALGQFGSALAYVLLSVILCLGGCWLGYAGASNHL